MGDTFGFVLQKVDAAILRMLQIQKKALSRFITDIMKTLKKLQYVDKEKSLKGKLAILHIKALFSDCFDTCS